MDLTKKATFTLTAKEIEQLGEISKRILGKKNKSGMISFWINQNTKK